MNYLAFDFGDGTTSAAFYSGIGEPAVMSILPSLQEIPSLLNYQPGPTGRPIPIVGQNAVAVGDTGYGLRMNWKSRPTQMEQTPGYPDEAKIADTKVYMRKVYSEFLATNPGCVTADTQIVIGVPSAWSKEDREIYRGYAEEAGMKNVLVISESQAAYLYAQKFLKDQNGKCLSSKIIENGLLLIDVGSSTTDFTFTRGMHSERYGIPLGAKYVDENIFRYGCLQPTVDCEAVKLIERSENRDARMRMVYACRERKEQYFSLCSADNRSVTVKDRVEEQVSGDGLELSFRIGDCQQGKLVTESLFRMLLDTDCDDRFLVALRRSSDGQLVKASWRDHFREGLRFVKENLVKDSSAVSIVVTGGASRMYFIGEDIRQVFGSEVPVLAGIDTDRSFSVVKGLAWAGYAINEISACGFAVKSKLETSEFKGRVRCRIRSEIVSGVASYVKAYVLKDVREKITAKDCWLYTTRKEIRDLMRQRIDAGISSYVGLEDTRAKIDKSFNNLRTDSDVTSLYHDVVCKFGRLDIQRERPNVSFKTPSLTMRYMGALDLNTAGDDLYECTIAYVDKAADAIEKFFKMKNAGGNYKEPETKYLPPEKRKWLADNLDSSWQNTFWQEVSRNVENAFDVGENGRSFVESVCESFIDELKSEIDLELRALQGVFGDE